MADYLLDTSALILALRGQPPALDLMDELGSRADLFISVIGRTEVSAGMHPEEEARTLALLEALTSLPVSPAVADQAGRWIYEYARRGVQLTVPDALIGATAVEHRLVLATTNVKHFPMPELRIHPLNV